MTKTWHNHPSGLLIDQKCHCSQDTWHVKYFNVSWYVIKCLVQCTMSFSVLCHFLTLDLLFQCASISYLDRICKKAAVIPYYKVKLIEIKYFSLRLNQHFCTFCMYCIVMFLGHALLLREIIQIWRTQKTQLGHNFLCSQLMLMRWPAKH